MSTNINTNKVLGSTSGTSIIAENVLLPPVVTFNRLTEISDDRVTEAGDNRVTE